MQGAPAHPTLPPPGATPAPRCLSRAEAEERRQVVTRVQNSDGDTEVPARVHLCDGTSPSLTQEREQATPVPWADPRENGETSRNHSQQALVAQAVPWGEERDVSTCKNTRIASSNANIWSAGKREVAPGVSWTRRS